MKSVSSATAAFRILFMGALVVLFTTGCSKHEDDCSAPENDEPEATTKAFTVQDGPEGIDEERPAGANYRGVEADEDNTGGDGISDDGDDEADGEGNKKNRPQH